MPIGVQLPGYRPAQAGAVADIMNAVNNWRSGAATRGVAEQEAKGKQLANEQTQLGMNANKQLADETSPLSVATVGSLKAKASMAKQMADKIGLDSSPFDQVINATSSGVSTKDKDGNSVTRPMTGFEAMNMDKQYSPLYEDLSKALQAQISGGAAKLRAGAAADSDARSVANEYHSNMKAYKGVNDDIRKIESVLKQKDKQGNPLITDQAMKEANFAFNRIMSPGHMSEAGLKETEYASASADFAAALQRLTANPQDTGARHLVEHMVDAAHRVGNVSNQNALRALEALDAGNSSLQLPGAQHAAKSTSGSYRKMFSAPYPEVGDKPIPTPAQAAAELERRQSAKKAGGR